MPEDEHTEAIKALQAHVAEQERRIAELKDTVAARRASASARRRRGGS